LKNHLSGHLNTIREREYKVRQGSLLMRPVWVLGDMRGWRLWDNFNRLVAIFNYNAQWSGRRNKLKALREALRAGESVVQEFLHTYEMTLPAMPKAPAALHETGWEGTECGYFDALEAMDHHFFLDDTRAL